MESQLLGLKHLVAEKQSFAEEAMRAREEAVLVSEARPLSLGVVNILLLYLYTSLTPQVTDRPCRILRLLRIA